MQHVAGKDATRRVERRHVEVADREPDTRAVHVPDHDVVTDTVYLVRADTGEILRTDRHERGEVDRAAGDERTAAEIDGRSGVGDIEHLHETAVVRTRGIEVAAEDRETCVRTARTVENGRIRAAELEAIEA